MGGKLSYPDHIPSLQPTSKEFLWPIRLINNVHVPYYASGKAGSDVGSMPGQMLAPCRIIQLLLK